MIRDTMLAASGELNRQMYGPSMFPAIPAAALAGSSDPGKIWPPFDERAAARRTIYAFVKRSLIVPLLEVLDFCDTARSAARRGNSSVPTQALTLLNGDFVNLQARHLADRLEREAGPATVAQIERAYQLSLCRSPRDGERSALWRFWTEKCGHGSPKPYKPAHRSRPPRPIMTHWCRSAVRYSTRMSSFIRTRRPLTR